MQAAREWTALGLVLAALLACKSKKENPTGEATPPPTTTATASGLCPTGKSMDPNQAQFRPAVSAFKDKDYKTAQELLDRLAKEYPKSATVRVWRGDAALFDKSAKTNSAAENSLPFYEEAEKLHDKGCVLPEFEHYYLRMDYAYAQLRLKKADEAIRHLDIAKKQWDNSAEVFYHLARAYCLKDDVDSAAESFEKALEIAKSLRRPKFLRSHNSLDDWIRRSRTQSEFGPLRRDKRYREIIKKMKSED